MPSREEQSQLLTKYKMVKTALEISKASFKRYKESILKIWSIDILSQESKLLSDQENKKISMM